jgi:dihydrofolate reductase
MNPSETRPFKAVAAMALNRVIGANNRLPWHLPEDFKWFKQLTTGHVLVMGRKTFESIGKPLPNRTTLVLSRSAAAFPGAQTVSSLEELLQLRTLDPARQFFICGGANLYRQTLPLCSDLYLTLVKREATGDAWFPPFEHLFHLKEELRNFPEFSILHYESKEPPGATPQP